MITHAEAEAKFKKCRDKERGYKLAADTRLQRRGHAFVVRLHETDVVIIRPDGTYRLNSGRWRTVTTKNRMNMVLPCCVSQRKGIWCIGDKFYTDGMLIDSDGIVIGKTICMKEALKIKTRVDSVCNKFTKFVTKRCLGLDIRGWEKYSKHALPRVSNKSSLTKLWNDITSATFYWREWLDDNGHNLFLIMYLATLARGYDNPKIFWELMRNDCLRCVDSPFIPDHIRALLRPRKLFITNMILAGELNE